MGFERLFENFENVEKVEECELIGSVPPWLKGTMVRNGPGMFKIGDTEYRHWFDGMAYIQRYHFVDGKMYYSARYLESDDYKKNMKAQRIVATSFGTRTFPDPCKTLFQRLASYFLPDDSLDNCSVAFTTLGDAVYALTESPYLVRIDVDTLDYLEKVDIREKLNVSLHIYSAHQHSDSDGNLYNVGNSSNSHSFENTELLGTVAAANTWAPSYYHSFGITENYFILFESPERINLKKIIFKNFLATSFNECMYWDDSLAVNVILFDRINSRTVERKITSDAFFTFHHANAFEKDGFVVVDYCKYDNPGSFDDLLLEHMRSGSLISKIKMRKREKRHMLSKRSDE
ncbi:hypothetical protein NECAME_16451 [Necator americanus]|uniref:Retinal pigment epithelial membrane protein n=1 Tax=Necator americanus TaxID=51031 RepID=W2TXA6_NECAM|nr:hypothetical protein NECAME_16451 [Necator americanus]ETN86264.1 hypothetical protein NECAME_16451 [Necator americanus]